MPTRTADNTKPDTSHYSDIDLLRAIVAAGDQYKKAQDAINVEAGPHQNSLWLGPVAVMYLDECVGYLAMEGDWVNYHEAEMREGQ